MEPLEPHDFYWNSLQLWQYDLKSVEHAYRREVKTSRGIKIFIACVSSVAVAAWALWGAAPLLWGALVAAGQVLSVIYEYTQYRNRIVRLGEAADQLDKIYESAEEDWLRIANGEYDEDEILALRNSYSKEWASANRGILKSDTVTLSKRAARTVNNEAIQHMQDLYGCAYEQAYS